jgi:hypothetical protein
VIIGATFGKIVSSLVDDILMPPIGLLVKNVNFTDLVTGLNGKSYPTLAAAKSRRRADAKLRHICEYHHQLPYRGLLRVHHHPTGESLGQQARASGTSYHQGLPAVCYDDSNSGQALRALHLAARDLGFAGKLSVE